MCAARRCGTVTRMTTRLAKTLPRLLAAVVVLLGIGVPAGAAPAALVWGDCPGGGGRDGMECARLQVPLDWSKPTGRRVTLMLGRLAAQQPSAGTVLVNYGGPGAPGVEYTRDRLFTGQQPFAALRQRMDVVTWDPRGYPGWSTPALDFSCLASVTGRGMPDLPRDPAGFAALAAGNAAAAEACRRQDPELFDHLDTASNVRDMEAIRRALRLPALHLYMGSYGSVYGESYASRYPRRVRGMVIDGGADHATPFDRAQDAMARDNGARMDRFADWCAAEAACPLHGRDVRQAWRALAAAADRAPVPAAGTGATFDGWTMREVATGWLVHGGADSWTRFAGAVVTAEGGDATGFVSSPQLPYPSMSYPVSECHEWPHPAGHADLAAAVRRLDAIDPDLGAAGTMVPDVLACVGWPATDALTDPPRALPAGLPPLLGVGAWGDFPATERVVSRVPGSSTIYHDGTGHELYVTGNACVIGYVDEYFLTGSLPAPRTPC
jgi:pimeloyl-ACP methyl ester carboxylesterase